MAIYRLSAKTISRGKGQSAVAAAAYRSGEKLYDEIDNRHKDYGKKTGVIHAEIMIPENAPREFENRQFLWNQVEASERRKDSQLAREIQLALPKELNREQNQELVFDFCKTEYVDRGMIADISIHDELNGNGNHHAHVMLTTREVTEDGFGHKNRDWNQKELLHHWRESWADHVNHALERSGHEERVDHRSSYEQTIFKLSEKELEEEQTKDNFKSFSEATEKPHVSLAAIHMGKRGKKSWQLDRFKQQFERAKEYFISKYQQLKERFSDDGSRRFSFQGPGQVRSTEHGFDSPTRSGSELPAGDRTEDSRGRGAVRSEQSAVDQLTNRLKAFADRLESIDLRAEVRLEDRLKSFGERLESEFESVKADLSDQKRRASGDRGREKEPGRIDANARQPDRPDSLGRSPKEKDNVLQDHGYDSDTIDHTHASGRGSVVDYSADVNDTEVGKPKRSRRPRQERDPATSRRKRDFERKQVFEFMGRNPKATIDNLQQSFPNVKDNALKRHISAWEQEQKRQGRQRERGRDDGFGRGR